MKKKIVLAVIAAALVLAAAIGTTFASFNTESENPGEATITLNDMQVALAAAPGEEERETIPEVAMPGQEVNLKEYVVQNALEQHICLPCQCCNSATSFSPFILKQKVRSPMWQKE